MILRCHGVPNAHSFTNHLLIGVLFSAVMPLLLPTCCGDESIFHPPEHCVSPHINEGQLLSMQGGAVIFKNACVDQGNIVLHDPQYLEGDDGTGNVPSFDITRFNEFIRHADIMKDALRPIYGKGSRWEPLSVRLPSELEAQRDKYFSNCTVPLIIYQHWLHNYAEFFTRGPTFAYRMLQDNTIDRNITFVLASYASVPLLPYHRMLMQPFSDYQVTSLASFSSRRSVHTPSNSTAEGFHIRCFKRLAIMGIDHAGWSSTYLAGQEILQYYSSKGLLPQPKVFKSDNSTFKILFGARFYGDEGVDMMAGQQKLHRRLASGRQMLRRLLNTTLPDFPGHQEVFPGTRRILNLKTILEQCNSYDWSEVLEGSRWKNIECRVRSYGRDLLSDMAVMQQPNMFMSLHGSEEMNTMFMPRGTSKVQMRPLEFGTVYRYMSNGYWPLVCLQGGHPLQCWFINFDEEDSWEPGIFERINARNDGGQNMHMKARDRHLKLPFEHMVFSMKRIMPVHGNMETFKRKWDKQEICWTFNQNKTVTYTNHIGR